MREKGVQVVDWVVIHCKILSTRADIGLSIQSVPASRASGVAVPFVVVIERFFSYEATWNSAVVAVLAIQSRLTGCSWCTARMYNLFTSRLRTITGEVDWHRQKGQV